MRKPRRGSRGGASRRAGVFGETGEELGEERGGQCGWGDLDHACVREERSVVGRRAVVLGGRRNDQP